MRLLRLSLVSILFCLSAKASASNGTLYPVTMLDNFTGEAIGGSLSSSRSGGTGSELAIGCGTVLASGSLAAAAIGFLHSGNYTAAAVTGVVAVSTMGGILYLPKMLKLKPGFRFVSALNDTSVEFNSRQIAGNAYSFLTLILKHNLNVWDPIIVQDGDTQLTIRLKRFVVEVDRKVPAAPWITEVYGVASTPRFHERKISLSVELQRGVYFLTGKVVH